MASATGATVPVARIAGGLLLVMAASAMFAELGVRSTLVVPGDARATAERILASPDLFRLGFAGYLVAFLCDVPVAVLFFAMLRPVSQTGALVAMAFRLVYTAVVGACLLPYLGAVLVLSGSVADGLSAFDLGQRQALALLGLDLFKHGFSLALVFFGVHLVVLGWLLFRSLRLPRVFGALVALGGLGYLTDSFASFLAPAFQAKVAAFLGMLAMSELALAVWLVVKGLKAASPADRAGVQRSVPA